MCAGAYPPEMRGFRRRVGAALHRDEVELHRQFAALVATEKLFPVCPLEIHLTEQYTVTRAPPEKRPQGSQVFVRVGKRLLETGGAVGVNQKWHRVDTESTQPQLLAFWPGKTGASAFVGFSSRQAH